MSVIRVGENTMAGVYTGQFEEGQSGNPQGRKKGQFSAVNEMKRSRNTAMRNVARACMAGDVQASIAILRYMQDIE